MARISTSVLSLFQSSTTDSSPPSGDVSAPTEATAPTITPRRVGELVGLLKKSLRNDFASVAVLGEISAFSVASSGHCYFDLKDEQAALPCVMYGGTARSVKFRLDNGQQIIVYGRIDLYERKSSLQLVVERIEPVGLGALALAFQQLKEKLGSEGLFDPAYKRPLPFLPRTVGIVTSPQAAALQDMLKVLGQRNASVHILLAPTRVQGEGAAQEIAQALTRLDLSGRCDVIIVGRGGGSLEDLWAFNEEPVARAIAACQTPVVSAVGHETDHTIADLVADVRAATPSHAAQLVLPATRDELLQRIQHIQRRMRSSVDGAIHKRRTHLRRLQDHLVDPRLSLRKLSETRAQLAERMQNALLGLLKQKQRQLQQQQQQLQSFEPRRALAARQKELHGLLQRLQEQSPADDIQKQKRHVEKSQEMMTSMLQQQLVQMQHRLQQQTTLLHSLSPLAVLDRGYTVVTDTQTQSVITSSQQVIPEQELQIRFADGSIRVRVLQSS